MQEKEFFVNNADHNAAVHPISFSDDSYNVPKDLVQNVVGRLYEQHCSRYATYNKFRSVVPLLALTVGWFLVHHAALYSADAFRNMSISVSCLMCGLFVWLTWQIGTVRLASNNAVERPLVKNFVQELCRVLFTSILCGIITMALLESGSIALRAEKLGLLVSILLFAGWFILSGILLISADISPFVPQQTRALIIGTGQRAANLRTKILAHNPKIDIIGCLDDMYIGSNDAEDKYLGGLSLLPSVLKQSPVKRIYIGLPIKSHYAEIQSVIEIAESIGVEVHYGIDVFPTARTHHLPVNDGHHWSRVGHHPVGPVQGSLKRMMDVAISLLVLILAAPLMVAIAIGIKLSSRGPVLFVQRRFGFHRELFPMFKFRTMVVDAEKRQAALETLNQTGGPTFKIKNDPRITPFGAFLRRTSLDELPQLFNVLRGEMSLVGPRPLPLRDVDRFQEDWLLRRFSAVPGLTCLWQIRGRSTTTFEDWIRFDLEYIDRWSLGLDLVILLKTIPAVVRGSGAM